MSGFTYTYYASGSQKSKTDHHGTVTTYVYDDLNRLVQESEAGGQTVNYAYDVRGNRTQQTVTGSASYTVSYTYDAANRLTREQKTVATLTDTTTYTYDANGNLKSQLTVGSSGTSAAAYRYDAYDRLISSTTGSQRTTYTYDPQGLRLSKQTGDTRTVFLSEGGNVAAEVVNGQLTATYLRGANLIARNGEYYLFNAHGDVVNLTSASGAVTKTYAYDAFGNEKNPDEADTNPFRYCGEYFDSETGTYYLRARYYDPAVGRFTQQDTHWNVSNIIYGDNPQKISEREDALGLKTYTCAPQISAIMQSGNLYAYGVNNPVMYADLTGNSIVLTCILVGAALGALAGGYAGAKWSEQNLGCVDGDCVLIGAGTGALLGSLAGWSVGTVAAAVGTVATAGCSGTLGATLYSTWQEAEQAIRSTYDAVKYTFTDLAPGMHSRIVDGYNQLTGVIYEVKYGYASLSRFIQTEIARDAYLLQDGQVKSVEWHFFVSSVTGQGGPSTPLYEALLDAGIKVVLH